MFGGQGTGLFGGGNKPAGGGLFGGGTGGSAFGGQPQNTSGGLFGGGQSNNQGGVFGQSSQPSAFGGANSAFGNPQNNSAFGGGSAFGGNQNQGGLFGQQQPAQQGQQGSLFGQTQAQQPNNNGTGLFGGGGQGGAFGQAAQNAQGQGLFGGGAQNQNQGGGIFGQSNLGGQPSGGGGLFGTVSTAINQSFMGQPQQNSSPFGSSQPNQGGTGIFGNSQPANNTNSPFGGSNQQGNSFFGNNNQQQQQASNQGGLFGTFAPSSNQPAQNNNSSLFGQSNPQQNNSAFGNTSIIIGGTNTTNTNNKLGGTTWGVPTNQQQQQSVPTQTMQPVRSKNPKLDAKHLVKCIAALDQFQGCCKEQIRINYIQSGGQQPNISQQNQGNAGFAKPLNNLTTSPSFGIGGNAGGFLGQGVNTGGSLLGGNKPAGQTSLFGAPQQTYGQQPGGGSLFGQPQQQGGSLFGQPQQQQQPSSFGQPQQGGSLFGSSSQPAFGVQPQQQGGSLFGQPAQQQQQPSLFGAPQPGQSSSLFGGQPQTSAPSLFGGAPTSSPLQAPPSLFSTPGGVQPQAAPSPYGAAPQGTPQFGLTGAPQANPIAGGNFSQMMAPLFQNPQQQLDPTVQLLLPQLLLATALQGQNQGQAQTGAAQPNPTLDLISKLLTNLNVNNNNKPADQGSLFGTTSHSHLLTPTPFDEFIKEQADNKWSSRNQERSLFSQAEIRQFQELDARSYIDRIHRPHELRQESFRLRNSYRPAQRKTDPLGQNYKIVSRSYKQQQDQARKRYTPTDEDLPEIGSYSISPSLDKLKTMTIQQLKNVSNVVISNKYGSVQFLEPICLYKANIGSSIKISQDNIEILDEEMEEKKVRMTFVNFGNYRSLKADERNKLMKRMRLWLTEYDMVEVSHDTDNGQLVVQTLD